MALNSDRNQFIGISGRRKSTKIHAVVDGIYVQLSSGNVHNSILSADMLSYLDISDSIILADKAYGTNEILDYIQQ